MIAPIEASVSALARAARSLQTGSRARSRLFVLVAGLVAAVFGTSCDRVALQAPSGSEVSLTSTSTTIPLGGSATITANVIEAGGTPVHDGTVVNFSTTIGTIEPSEAQTDDGLARATLRASGQSGTALVRAFSGGATSEDLEILIGAAAVEQVVLSANPSSVSASRGGTVTLSAIVVDEGNSPVANVPVTFTTTAGQLSAQRANTDALGEARVTMTTTREARVRAQVGSVQSNELTIVVNNAPRVSVTPSPLTVPEGTAVTFSYQIQTDNNTPMRSVVIDFGDGTSQSLGTALTGSGISHVYRNQGTFAATVTAVDINGETGSGFGNVVVTPAPPLVVNVAVSPNPTRVNNGTTISITLTNPNLTQQIANVSYDFGDGTNQATGGTTTSKVYTRVGGFDVRATVRLIDGRQSTGGPVHVIVNPQ